MESRTITFCAYDKQGSVGGPLEWAGDFVAFLLSHRWSIRVLVLCRGGRPSSMLASRLDEIGVENRVLDSALVNDLESEVEWILSEWKRAPTSFFVANLVLPAMYAAKWIRHAGAITVAILHSDPNHDPFYSDVLRTFVSGLPELRVDAVVAVSQLIAREAESHVREATTRVVTIPCGTRLTDARATKPDGPLHLIYAGRLVQRQKRIRDVVEAMLRASENLGTEASICGDGDERQWVEARLVGQSAVRYLGIIPTSEMDKVFARHHAVVLLSDFEGLPISVVSAMACGVVPVCLEEPSGSNEIIQNGFNGLIVSDRGTSFVKAVDALRSPSYWEVLSHNAITTVSTRYSHEVVMPRWIELFESMPVSRTFNLRAIPAGVTLGRYRPPELFKTYPQSRRSPLTSLRARLNRSWSMIRSGVRARSRLRRIISLARERL